MTKPQHASATSTETSATRGGGDASDGPIVEFSGTLELTAGLARALMRTILKAADREGINLSTLGERAQ